MRKLLLLANALHRCRQNPLDHNGHTSVVDLVCIFGTNSRVAIDERASAGRQPTHVQAHGAMTCEKKLEIIAGATHLFEEPGALNKIVEIARDWFLRQLNASSS